MNLEFLAQPHCRFNPLTREWILVSPHRTRRPWFGRTEKPPDPERLAYDPDCSLCPGNMRLEGVPNPNYTGPYIIDNAFPPLLADIPPASMNHEDLLIARSERGQCRLMCFSPHHHLTLAEMTTNEIRQVVDTWIWQFRELSSQEFVRYVQIFENKGEMMGSGYPHPHSQIWGTETTPNEPAKEQLALADYLATKKSCLLCDYLGLELAIQERLVCENDHFVALVPFWALWPFETLLLSKRHVACLLDLDEAEKDDLADILRRLTTRYDNLFETSFPYALGFHQRPTDGEPDGSMSPTRLAYPEWHLHGHLYPPLLRSATIRKYMAGFELLATPLRDLTAEGAAERLRELSELHYKKRDK